MLIAKIKTEHQKLMEEKDEEHCKKLSQLTDNERIIKLKLDDVEREKGELDKKWREEVQLRIKLQEEIYKNIRSHEEEV